MNNGFATLRQHIPSHVAQGYGDRGKKLSKVETLRMAVEYIRGLQRLLAEADGLDYDSVQSRGPSDSSVMLPSPTGSVYSGSTHNGSGEVLGLAGSELDEQQSAEALDEAEAEAYLVDEDEEEDEAAERRDAKRFREAGPQNRQALPPPLSRGEALCRGAARPSGEWSPRPSGPFDGAGFRSAAFVIKSELGGVLPRRRALSRRRIARDGAARDCAAAPIVASRGRKISRNYDVARGFVQVFCRALRFVVGAFLSRRKSRCDCRLRMVIVTRSW